MRRNELLLQFVACTASLVAGASTRADLFVPAYISEDDSFTASPGQLFHGEIFGSTTESAFGGSLTNNGTVIGPTTADMFLTFTGHVSGAGDYTGNIAFDGQFSPGNSPAVVMFEGGYSLGPAGTLFVELGGTALGQFDRLEVAGNVSILGSLDVELINSFTLMPGNVFEIIDVGGTLSGQFAGLTEGSLVGNFSGVDLFISYAAGDGNNVSLYTSVPESRWISASAALLLTLMMFWNWRRANADYVSA